MSEAVATRTTLGPHDYRSSYFDIQDADLVLRARPDTMPVNSTIRYLPSGEDLSRFKGQTREKCRLFYVKKDLLVPSPVFRDMLDLGTDEHQDKKAKVRKAEKDIHIVQLEERGDVMELFLRYMSDEIDDYPTAEDLTLEELFGLFEAGAKYARPNHTAHSRKPNAVGRRYTLRDDGVTTALALEVYIRATGLQRTSLAEQAHAVVIEADYLKLPENLLEQLPAGKQLELSRSYIKRMQDSIAETTAKLDVELATTNKSLSRGLVEKTVKALKGAKGK